MRDFLDAILAFIGSTSLTDDEFASLTIESYGIDEATYSALRAIVAARESASTQTERLYFYFKAKGATFAMASDAKSNILLGIPLCN